MATALFLDMMIATAILYGFVSHHGELHSPAKQVTVQFEQQGN
jgi:hypothetical protein